MFKKIDTFSNIRFVYLLITISLACKQCTDRFKTNIDNRRIICSSTDSFFPILRCRNGHSILFTALSHQSDPKRECVSSSLFNLRAETLKKLVKQNQHLFFWLQSSKLLCKLIMGNSTTPLQVCIVTVLEYGANDVQKKVERLELQLFSIYSFECENRL